MVNEYIAAVLASGPRAYWKMDEASGFPLDSSGNGLHFTAGAASLFQQAGPFPDFPAQRWNGSSPSRTITFQSTGDVTFETWVNVISTGTNFQMFANFTSGGSSGWGVNLQDSTHLMMPRGKVGATLLPFGTAFVSNVWTHWCLVRRGGIWMYFRNGAVDNANAGNTGISTPGTGTTSLGGGSTILFSHVAVYDKGLFDAEVLAHYQAATAAPLAPFVPRVTSVV